jgi:drug/metabolite transporter (DMT)-like permease
MSHRTKGFLLVLVSALSFSIIPILGKIAYSMGISPLNLLAWRFVIAAVAIWLISPFFVGRRLLVKKVDLLHFILQGVIGYGFASIGFFTALTYLNASLVSILLYLYPSLVTIFARVVFKERLTKHRLVVLTITFIGSLLVTNIFQATSSPIVWRGILWGILGAVAYSVFNLYSQKTTANAHPLVVSTYSLTAMAVFFALLAPRNEFLNINPKGLAVAGIIGIVCTILPIVSYLAGIKLIGAGRAAIISTFEPAFTIILAFVFLKESLTFLQTLGALLIFGGVLALQFTKTAAREVQLSETPSEFGEQQNIGL